VRHLASNRYPAHNCSEAIHVTAAFPLEHQPVAVVVPRTATELPADSPSRSFCRGCALQEEHAGKLSGAGRAKLALIVSVFSLGMTGCFHPNNHVEQCTAGQAEILQVNSGEYTSLACHDVPPSCKGKPDVCQCVGRELNVLVTHCRIH